MVDVFRSINQYGVNYAAVSTAARTGLLDVASVGGQGGRRHLTLESALLALTVAAVAQTLGLAFRALLRIVRETGATVTAEGLTIPVAPAA